MSKDAAGIFVHKVENALFKLYQTMDGPHAVYVNEGEFGQEIRACVSCFYWQKSGTRHQWMVRQDIQDDDEKELNVIKTQVCVHLAAAEMGEDRRRYSAEIQSEFDRIWRYVREWLGEGEETHGEDRLHELLKQLKELIAKYPV